MRVCLSLHGSKDNVSDGLVVLEELERERKNSSKQTRLSMLLGARGGRSSRGETWRVGALARPSVQTNPACFRGWDWGFVNWEAQMGLTLCWGIAWVCYLLQAHVPAHSIKFAFVYILAA